MIHVESTCNRLTWLTQSHFACGLYIFSRGNSMWIFVLGFKTNKGFIKFYQLMFLAQSTGAYSIYQIRKIYILKPSWAAYLMVGTSLCGLMLLNDVKIVVNHCYPHGHMEDRYSFWHHFEFIFCYKNNYFKKR